MSDTFSSRRLSARSRLGVVVLLTLVLSTMALFSPNGATAQPRSPAAPGAARAADAVHVAVGTYATTTANLNLRTGPSLQHEILTVMPWGSTVQITGGIEYGFYPVSFNGLSGYAYSDYLFIGGNAVPVTTGYSGGSTAGVATGQEGIVAIIYAAADAYGQPRDDMLRVAICESGLDPYNVTPPYDASGLFQFLPSTWASTPFAGQSIFDPVANANAAAWMWSVGRRGEWVCQ